MAEGKHRSVAGNGNREDNLARLSSREPLMSEWTLQDAKNRFSEVVRKTISEGEQHVTVRGEESVTVIATRELRRLRGQPEKLSEFLRKADLEGLTIPERDTDTGREIDL